MNKEFFSENELLELEAIEVRGGNTASIMAQNKCPNNVAGCGVGADQTECPNNVAYCGGNPPPSTHSNCSTPPPSMYTGCTK